MRIASTLALLVLAACGAEEGSSSSSLTRVPGACGDIETHVIGVWDGGGDSTVTILRPGEHVLVLSAHEATNWHVELGAGATLAHVYLVGYHKQTVTGVPAGVDIISDSADAGDPYAVGYKYPNHDTQSLLTLEAKRTHHDATSFHGCYAATNWTIGEDMAVTSDCVTGQADAVTGCGGDGGTCGNHGGSDGSGGGTGSGSSSDGSGSIVI
jgi:hypothetical protein